MIRLARPSDLPAIPAIEASAAAMFRGTHMDFPANVNPNPRSHFGNAIDRGLMWVAEVDGVVAGFLFAEAMLPGLYLRELAVAVPAQRRGLGSGLVAAALAEARARALPAAWLTTDRTLAWNAPFYVKLGFVIRTGDAIPVEVTRRLAGQFAAGFDPAARCAMTLTL